MKTFWQNLHENHEHLKRKIHGFRIPLSSNGQRVMKVIYFSIPIVVGYFIMEVINFSFLDEIKCFN